MVHITVTNANGQQAAGNGNVVVGPGVTTVDIQINGGAAFINQGGYYTLTWNGAAHNGFMCIGVPTPTDPYYHFRQD
jgi:hypothetical protein